MAQAYKLGGEGGFGGKPLELSQFHDWDNHEMQLRKNLDFFWEKNTSRYTLEPPKGPSGIASRRSLSQDGLPMGAIQWVFQLAKEDVPQPVPSCPMLLKSIAFPCRGMYRYLGSRADMGAIIPGG